MDTAIVALRVLLSLAAVLGLLWYLQRRLTRGPKAGRARAAKKPVTVVTRQSISNKASVVVVDVEGSRLVLGVTEHGVTVLQSAEAPVEPAEAFATTLHAVESPAEAETVVADAAAQVAPTAKPNAEPAVALAPVFTPSQGQLAGSILSIDTWKQAAATLRRAR